MDPISADCQADRHAQKQMVNLLNTELAIYDVASSFCSAAGTPSNTGGRTPAIELAALFDFKERLLDHGLVGCQMTEHLLRLHRVLLLLCESLMAAPQATDMRRSRGRYTLRGSFM